MRTYPIIDGHAYVIDDNYRELRIFAPDLEAEIPYILKENIKVLSIDTLDPVALHKWNNCRGEVEFRKMESDSVDLHPLEKCRQIETLNLDGNLVGSEVLEELPQLKQLSIDNESNKNPVRIDRLKSLEFLSVLKYGKNIIGLSECIELKTLWLWNYGPKTRNLRELAKLQKLEELQLVRPRIDTVDGIEDLSALKSFEVYYSRTLNDVSALDRCQYIKNVSLEHVPKIKPTNKDNVW